MTTTKKTDETSEPDPASEAVASQVAAEQDDGFVGVKVDPNPNEAYALTTGPTSPSHVTSPYDAVKQFGTAPKEG